MKKPLALLSLLLLAGCFGGGDETVRAPAPQRMSPRMIGVQPGDTIADLAHRYDVPLRDLIEVNGLQPPYRLVPGQQLIFPVPHSYTVQRGDTLYGISRLFAVDQSEIVRLNNLREPYDVKIGQTLRLPVRGNAPVMRSAAGTPPPVPAPQPAVPAPAPSSPIVAAPLPPQPQVQAAPLPAPAPAPQRAPQTSPTVLAPQAAAPSAPAPAAPAVAALAPPIAVAPAPAPAPAPRAAAPVEDAPAPVGARLLQPVTGTILSGYGPKPDGTHNDGINIAAPLGTPVKAADRGSVVYAGNELRGFGNLVLLKHEDGTVTAYAHLDRIDVAKGDNVARGQRIGTVGRTGSVSEPQLHFELRRGAKAVDPAPSMRSG